jgi:hypothetical protein
MRNVGIAVVAAVTLGVLAPAVHAATGTQPWSPGPAHYGVAEQSNVPVTMSDGTILRVNIFRPADLTTGAAVATGHKLRLTLMTADQPWAVPSAAQVTKLAGGVYAVQRNASAASLVNLPLTDTSTFTTGCEVCS